MRQKEIEIHLRSAISKLSGCAGAEILAKCREAKQTPAERPEGAVDPVRPVVVRPVLERRQPPRPRRATPIIRIGAAAAAALVLMAGGFILLRQQMPQPIRAQVYLDVNPGLKIDVGERDEVLGISGTNADGIRLAEGIGRLPADESIETVYSALIDRLVSSGYLTETYNSILISVRSVDDNRAERLQTRLIRQTGIALSDQNWQPAVLVQRLPAGNEPPQDMTGGSPGRRALVGRLLARYPDLSAEDLTPLKINDLNILLGRAATAEPELIRVGTASEKAYIGRSAALGRLRQHPDFAGRRIESAAVTFDCEDGRMVYEVEWIEHDTVYEVSLDALTGQILSQKTEPAGFDPDGDGEIDDDVPEHDNEVGDSDPERPDDGGAPDRPDDDRTTDPSDDDRTTDPSDDDRTTDPSDDDQTADPSDDDQTADPSDDDQTTDPSDDDQIADSSDDDRTTGGNDANDPNDNDGN